MEERHILVLYDGFAFSLAILLHIKNHELNLDYHLAIEISQIDKYKSTVLLLPSSLQLFSQ